MIRTIKSGIYKLIETKSNTKILYLDKKSYAWIEPKNMGEILVATHNVHKTDCVLSTGNYKIYDVVDEPFLSDQTHLELEVGMNQWQGYVLLSGLPTNKKLRGRIIPTHEIITNKYYFGNDVMSKTKHIITVYDAKRLGQEIGIDFDKIDFEQFRLGLAVEMEHGSGDKQTNVTNDDPTMTGKIAWAHLKESPDYYARLAKMESED